MLREVTLDWSDKSVPLDTHACFYYTDEATLKRTLEFLRVGLAAEGEFNLLFADAGRHEAPPIRASLPSGSPLHMDPALGRATNDC